MTWLTTIVRHRAIDQLRRSGSRAENRSISDEALLGLAAGEAYSADRGAELGALQRCLGELVIAVLADQNGEPAWITTAGPGRGEIAIAALRPQQSGADHSFELWGIAADRPARSVC
jgi:hypothetical protein